ncbi:MAG: radical SAM protein [Candidatus Nanohaloarchaeota archaeon QJJ-7]|nr:radical SAM protein [Candidatus Nanohaloarchaeota archaeon QJJ-7]
MDLIDKIGAGMSLLRSRYGTSRIPLTVSIEVTRRCNADCDYCDYKGEGEEISTSELKEMLEEMAELGTRQVVLTGGEPLMRDDIGEVVSSCKDLGMDVKLNSNGALVPYRLDDIEEVDKLTVSIDGPPKVHNSLRGEESFGKAMEGIKNAKDAGISVSMTTVISTGNSDSLDWVVEKSRELGVPVNFQIAVGGGPAGNEKYGVHTLPKEEIDEKVEQLKEYKRENPELVAPSIPTLDTIKKVYVDEEEVKCGLGVIGARIERGDITHCAHSRNSSGLDEGFEEGWRELSEEPDCNYACCTGNLELSNVYGLEPRTLQEHIFMDKY